VLVSGDDELIEHVADAEGGVGDPPVLRQVEAGAGGRLLRLERAQVGPLLEVRHREAGGEPGGEERARRLRAPEGTTGEAHRLGAEEERRGEPLALLAEVGGVLLGFEHRAVHVEPGDVAALLALSLEIGEALGVAHRLLERSDADLRGGHLRDALQEVEPALAQHLDRIEQRGVPGRTADGVVREVLELVEARGIRRPERQRSPLEIEARIGEDLRARDLGLGLSELRPRSDEVRGTGPQQLDELDVCRGTGKVE
jgi:hypothetical protein